MVGEGLIITNIVHFIRDVYACYQFSLILSTNKENDVSTIPFLYVTVV